MNTSYSLSLNLKPGFSIPDVRIAIRAITELALLLKSKQNKNYDEQLN